MLKYIYNETDRYIDYINKPSQLKDYKPSAWCTSNACCGDRVTKMGVKRDVPQSAIDCPICNSALYWGDEEYTTKQISKKDNFRK